MTINDYFCMLLKMCPIIHQQRYYIFLRCKVEKFRKINFIYLIIMPDDYHSCKYDTSKSQKILGQHFLRDLDVARRIAASLQRPDSCSDVLEIGPGTGVLTQFLLQQPDVHLTAVEIDKEIG